MANEPTELSAENMELFLRHLRRVNGHLPQCPICGNGAWQSSSLEVGVRINDEATQINHGGAVLPVATLACTRCFYLLKFAWLPVRASGEAS